MYTYKITIPLFQPFHRKTTIEKYKYKEKDMMYWTIIPIILICKKRYSFFNIINIFIILMQKTYKYEKLFTI